MRASLCWPATSWEQRHSGLGTRVLLNTHPEHLDTSSYSPQDDVIGPNGSTRYVSNFTNSASSHQSINYPWLFSYSSTTCTCCVLFKNRQRFSHSWSRTSCGFHFFFFFTRWKATRSEGRVVDGWYHRAAVLTEPCLMLTHAHGDSSRQ